MSLGQPVNWSSPTQSPAAQPELFRYQGEGYVRMGDGQILTSDNYLSRQSALNQQAYIDAANRYDPSEPTQAAARGMEAKPYRSPTTNQPVSRDQFFREHSRLNYQASANYDSAMRSRLANAGTAWDTPLPRGVTVDMIPTGGGTFAPAPSGGALAPLRSAADRRAGFTPLPRSAAVTGEPLRRPLNLGIKPPTQPLLNGPAVTQAAGGGLLYGGAASAAAFVGGAGFFEGAGAGIGGLLGGLGGGLVGGAAGGAAGGAVGTIPAPIVGTVSGAAVGGYVGGAFGAGIGGGLGSSLGSKLGRAIDDLIPDFFGGPKGYPNELPAEAMDAGAIVDPGVPPPFTGGQSPGVFYNVTASARSADPSCNEIPSSIEANGVRGPVNFRSTHNPTFSQPQGGLCPGFSYNEYYLSTGDGEVLFAGSGRGIRVSGISVSRADGQPDTGGNPSNVDVVRAPNPARQASPGATPRTLPPPVSQPTPTDTPWPGTEPQVTPDTTPLTPPAPVPNFNPTPTPDPAPTTTPGTTSEPPDLESPRETPPNLGDDPLTPPTKDPLAPLDKAAPTAGPKSPLSALNNPFAPLAVVIPIVLIDGLRQKINTPSGDLTDRSKPNPNIQVVKPPPTPVVNVPNPPTCIYERQRIMDIQNKATDVQEKASNPVSGFPGLYGIGIESRVKLGNVDQFMRKAWETTRIQKAINALTLVTTLHNAYYLSRDVGSTLGEMISLLLDTVGIDDEAGNPLDINAMVGKKVKDVINAALGEKLATNIGNSLTKASRIYQSASNVIWSIRNITDSTTDLLEITANNTGKIGNSLRESKVVDALTMPRFSENHRAGDATRRKTQRILDGIEQVDDTVGTLYAAVATVRDVQEEVTAAGQAKNKLIEEIGTLAPRTDVPENEPIKAAAAEADEASQAPNADPLDLEPANGTP
ncbi:hypothetical protein H6F75_22460 [Nodosilinea sp. FACHB-131]|uniref:hypothetical protein n=1 Tax=Cyanophyceae TaxID=3028117 RepID=UPI001684E685|nr:hypothetical protein [Nodosilinea sp. FACHB-131]MBD1876253.1 hypothetical protein [Nodosilinea sp. FACHB-131]